MSFQEKCQAYVNAVINALPATDKRLLESMRAQANDATCQEFCTHEWPDKAKLGSEEKLYMLGATDLTIQKGLLLKYSMFEIPASCPAENDKGGHQ